MNFDQAFTRLLGHEGTLSLDRRDRGNWTGGDIGKGTLKGTKYGISAMSYPGEDIENLTPERAKAIYRRRYWDAVRADELPAPVRYPVFDAAVNSGPTQAIKWLQRAVDVGDDGKLGPITLAAVNRSGALAAYRMTAERLDFMTSLPTWGAFGHGWSRRIASVLKEIA